MSDAIIAVDIGGTTIKGALVGPRGERLAEHVRASGGEHGAGAVIAEIQATVRALRDTPGVVAAGVGLAVCGTVDAAAGVALFSANLGFRDVPLGALVAEAVGLPTVIEHDVRAAGIAETAIGSLVDVDDYLLAVIGTGIGAVVGTSGQITRGALGLAGELGHIPVHPDGVLCACGQRGCLERYASGAAIARRYRELGGDDATTAEIAARRHDPAATTAWAEAVAALALALASVTLVLDPAVIVLGGGLSAAGGRLIEPLRRALGGRLGWRPTPPLAASPLGSRAGQLGAAVLAWRALGVHDFHNWYSPI